MYVFFRSVCVCLALCYCARLNADQWEKLTAELEKSHATLRANLLEAISVTIVRSDSNTKGVLVAREPETIVSKGGKVLSIRGGLVTAANEGYSFSASTGDGKAVNYLEGGKVGSRESNEVRRRKEAELLLSTHLNGQPLIDVFRSPKFKLIDVDQQGEQIVINSEFTDESGLLYSPLIIHLDSSNLHQLILVRATLKQVNAGDTSIDFEYKYFETPFGEFPVKLLKTFKSRLQQKTNGETISETEIDEFSDWNRPATNDSKFYLSAYGFDEPDIDALNRRPNWLRLTSTIALLIIAIGLVFWKIKKR
jgi:hypothetical protein